MARCVTSFCAIVNPKSGGGRKLAQTRRFLAQLKDNITDIQETQYAGQAGQLAQTAWKKGYRRFLVCGGDGTSFEVLNGLYPLAKASGEVPEFAFLPQGTGNSLLRDFNIFNQRDAFAAIVGGKKRKLDIILLEHEEGALYFMNLCSLGFVADVAQARQEKFRSWGQLGYVFAVFTELSALKGHAYSSHPTSSNSAPQEVALISINNSQCTGGKMRISPNSHVNDGQLDVVWLEPVSAWKLLRLFPKIFSGRHLRDKQVHHEQNDRWCLSSQKKEVLMIDGEVLQLRPKKFTLIPNAIEVLAP